ncbi:MAG: hypothetical protein JSV18_01805 [Candidatus Bathyarchaeota archaeon]|nr:MAG: hypothetical protein JSV18_01805 [Candidatus Bathyarchaeota archaeon]
MDSNLRSYIKIIGPPVLKAIRALEKVAVSMPEVRIMDTIISREIPKSLARDVGGYFSSAGVTIPVERAVNIISDSGESLGDYDFFFEWLEPPSVEEFHGFMEKLDEALAPLGCNYTITTKPR